MLDRVSKINGHEIYIPNKNDDIKFKYFSDVHYTYNFDKNKLNAILRYINTSYSDYVCIGGDIIDSTNIIKNRREQIRLLKWLERIAIYRKTLISCGNHDFMRRTNAGWEYDYLESFWKEVNEINNIQVSHFDPYYEDDRVIIYMPELDFEFYENEKRDEDIEILINKLDEDKCYCTNLNNKKIKIMLIHSPYLLSNPKIVERIKEFDIVLSGHMHKGLVMPLIDEIFKTNRGFISPYLRPFPDNSRGVKILKAEDGRETMLIMSGGITKTASDTFIKRNLNHLYPMDFEEISILTKRYNKNYK